MSIFAYKNPWPLVGRTIQSRGKEHGFREGAELEPKMKSKIPSNLYFKHSDIFAFSYSLQAHTTKYPYTDDLCVCNIFLVA